MHGGAHHEHGFDRLDGVAGFQIKPADSLRVDLGKRRRDRAVASPPIA
jgi:hypothetical protein